MSKYFLSSLVIIKFNDVSISWIKALKCVLTCSSIELKIEKRNNKIIGKCQLFHELNYYCPN